MHTKHYGEWTIHHDGDYEGKVIIWHDQIQFGEIPAEILYAFTADMIRSRIIRRAEDATTEEIFKRLIEVPFR